MAKDKEELQNEEVVEIGTGFFIKIFLIGIGLVAIIVGIPYLLMK